MWVQQLDETFTVGQFMEEIAKWKSEGFTDNDLWKSLEHYVQPDLLPTLPPGKGSYLIG